MLLQVCSNCHNADQAFGGLNVTTTWTRRRPTQSCWLDKDSLAFKSGRNASCGCSGRFAQVAMASLIQFVQGELDKSAQKLDAGRVVAHRSEQQRIR